MALTSRSRAAMVVSSSPEYPERIYRGVRITDDIDVRLTPRFPVISVDVSPYSMVL